MKGLRIRKERFKEKKRRVDQVNCVLFYFYFKFVLAITMRQAEFTLVS